MCIHNVLYMYLYMYYKKCVHCSLQLSILVHPDKNESDRERAQLAFDGMPQSDTALVMV